MAEFHWISKCVSSDIRLPLSVSPRLQPTSGTALARAGHSVWSLSKLPKFARRKTRDQATQYPFGSFWTFSLCQFTGFNTPDSPRSSGILSFQCNFFFGIYIFVIYCKYFDIWNTSFSSSLPITAVAPSLGSNSSAGARLRQAVKH